MVIIVTTALHASHSNANPVVSVGAQTRQVASTEGSLKSSAHWSGLNERFDDGVSFRYRVSDIQSGVALMDSRVRLGQRGLVAEQQLTETGIRFVYNAALETAWFVDDEKRRFHKIPMVISDAVILDRGENNAVDPANHDEKLARLPGFQLLDGLPRTSFCENLAAAYRPSLNWQGRYLDAWECRDKKNEFVRLDLYDPSMGIVAASVTAGGLVERWDELESLDSDRETYEPELSYIATSLSEFMSGKLEIGSYEAIDSEEQRGTHSAE